MDEIALKKGHREYGPLVTGQLSNGELVILGGLAGHEKAPLVEFFRSIPPRIVQGVQTVCCDLWEVYTEAVREEIPGARIVADRFHVAKHYRHAADQVQKQELLRLKQTLPKEQYQTLHGSYPAFWTPALAGGARENAKDLNKEERKVLRRFFAYSASAQQAYALREQLTAFFEMNLSRKQAQAKILRWIQQVRHSGLDGFNDILNLLAAWWDEITNFFPQRQTSGFVEGFNNKVKVLNRRCYGIFSLQHLFQRIYLNLHGYRFFAATTIYA